MKEEFNLWENILNGAVWGEYSDALLTATKPAKTTGLKTTAQSTTAIKLTWNKVSGATGYRIYKYNAKSKKYESVGYIPGKTEFTVSKLLKSRKKNNPSLNCVGFYLICSLNKLNILYIIKASD